MARPNTESETSRVRASRTWRLIRRLVWLAALALAGVWIGVGYIPSIDANWIWLTRAALFFAGAALMWFGYDTREDSRG